MRIIATLVKLAREASLRDDTFTSASMLRGTLDMFPAASARPARRDAVVFSAQRRLRIAVDEPECPADLPDRLHATRRIVRQIW